MKRRTFLTLLASAVSERALAQATVLSSCGSVTLSAGTPHNVTIDVNGQSCQSGASGGSGHSPQALAYLARTVGGNEGGNGANIATLIDGLVSDGVWAKLDALYVLAQQNRPDALLNLIGATYNLPTTGATWTAYQGMYVGGGTLDTGFNMVTSPSPHLTQNSGSLSAWGYGAFNTGNGAIDLGTVNGFGGCALIGNDSTNHFYGFISIGASNNSVAFTAPAGLLAVDRTSSSHTDFYSAGVNINVNTNPTQAPANANMVMGPTFTTLSAISFGASLGAAGQLALYNRLRTYMSSVGVP